MSVRELRVVLATLALGCAVSAGGCGSQARSSSAAHGDTSARSETALQPLAAAAGAGKKRSSSEPSLDGERCAAFLPLLPSSVAGFRAKSGAEGRDIDLGEGESLALLQRGYSKSGRALDLEIVDTRDAKPLRDLFERTRELERDGSAAVIRKRRVQGYDALAQWNDTSKSARVSVLVAGRFLMNLRLRPSDGVAPALELAEALPLAELAKLEPNALVTRRTRR